MIDQPNELSTKQSSDTPRLLEQLTSLVYNPSGVMTRELLLEPAGFGLGKLPATQQPDATTKSVCGFCATGCGLTIHLKDQTSVGLSPTTNYPVNLGMACPKGWEALEVLNSDDRATQPLVRQPDGKFHPTDWNTALELFCRKFKEVQAEHGDHSIAFLSTGQIATEEMAFLGALAKFGMGMRHGDGNTRQCMATAVTAYKQSFGFDAPPYTYQDFEDSDALFFVGANPCLAHPIMWERVMRNERDPEIVVIDPRRTETAMNATLHLPLAPKSDLALLYGIAKLLIERDALDHEFISNHTTSFEAFAEFVQSFTLSETSQRAGLSARDIERAAEIIAQRDRVSFWWTMGVNQSYEGTRVAQAIINIALMTGNIGRPGTGANSITGQCNAMGSRLFSNTTSLLGGRDFLNEEHRQQVADVLEIPVESIPTENSWAYDEIIDGIETGDIKGLWIIATNPAHSWINQSRLKKLRESLEFLVVQDMYHTTETARIADLILPAAGWGEKEGTFINSERRIGVHKRVAVAPGQALADFSIFRLIAEYWGCGELFKGWSSPAAAFEYMKKLSKGLPCDITGMEDYAMIDQRGGIQWPLPEGLQEFDQQRRLFEDGRFYHADGKAKFIFETPRPLPESTDDEYPLTLLTGRGSASQWHTQTRTAKSAVLRKLYPEKIYLEIHPDDAKQLGVESGQQVSVRSRRGAITAKAFVTSGVRPGQVFLPMHYDTTNQLTKDDFDPYSHQPSYKQCAVAVAPEGWSQVCHK